MIEWDISAAIASFYSPEGYLAVQPDAEGEGESGVAPYEAHHPLGFMARPLDAVIARNAANDNGSVDYTKAGQMLVGMEGGRGHVIALEDPRIVPTLPAIDKGESLAYGAAAGQFIRWTAGGSIAMMTTDKGGPFKGGNTVSWTLAPDGIRSIGPWGKYQHDAKAWRVTHVSGAFISMGGVGGLPSPADKFSSRLRLRADLIQIDGSVISFGPGAAPKMPVAQAAPLVGVLQAMQTAINALQLAISTAVTASGITTANIAQAASFVANAQTVVASCLPLIETNVAIG